jgi:DNA-binding NarL/FixJ family response regulator
VQFQLLAEFNDREHLVEHLTELQPDLVVIGLEAGESDEIGAMLLALMPTAKVLLISGAGDYAYLYEMRPWRSVLHDFSPASLLTAVVGG